MPKFVVTTIGTVRYTCQLVLDAPSEVEAEALALFVMPSISPNTCNTGDDLEDVKVNEVQTLEEGDEVPDETYTHVVLASERIGRETFLITNWCCGSPEYKVSITQAPSSLHPDGYVTEKGHFRDLEDAKDLFDGLVRRARKAALAAQ